MPSKISDLIKSTVADKSISKEEWDQIKPQLADVKKATEEMREVLELWANDEFKADDAVRREMRNMLSEAGYNIPYGATPKLDSVPEIVDSNITEVDKDFAVLLAQTGKTEQKTTIAVLDSGFQMDHPAFKDKEWTNPDEIPDDGIDNDNNGLVDDVHGWDFANGDKTLDGGDHGSHVSGIATRGTDRIEEIAVRAFEPLDAAKVAAAIDYACANGARAINMSFKVDDKEEVDAVKAAIERHPDVLFVKSAGNDGEKLVEGKEYGGYYGNWKTYGVETYLPMVDLPNMVVVAAADAKGVPADYTNWGLPYVTVAMRGSEVYSSVPGSRYEAMDGTSMASPNVTAVVAKCLTLAPKLTPYDVRQILVDATDKKPEWADKCVSGGLVNQARATRLAAMIGMTQHEGMDPQAAADKIGLKGEERLNILLLLKNYPVAIPVRPPPVVTTPTTPTSDPTNPPVTVTPATDPSNPTPVTVTPATPPTTPAVTLPEGPLAAPVLEQIAASTLKCAATPSVVGRSLIAGDVDFRVMLEARVEPGNRASLSFVCLDPKQREVLESARDQITKALEASGMKVDSLEIRVQGADPVQPVTTPATDPTPKPPGESVRRRGGRR